MTSTATATRRPSRWKPLATKPIEMTDGSWSFKPRRIGELAAIIEPGDLVYVEPAPYGQRWRAAEGEAPKFADLKQMLAARGISLAYAGCYYFRAVALVSP